jgi:glucose-6-phosphate 1-dehydrogenase
MVGDVTLFMHADQVEATWHLLTPESAELFVARGGHS